MRRLADDIWVAETPLRFLGVEVGRRMTVVRLAGGALWVHSPAPLGADLRERLAELGEPRFVVAASAIHGHRFMEQYRAAYPNVELLAPPGLDRRRRDLAFDGLLGSVPHPAWAGTLDQAPVLGQLLPEVVFLHRPSGTLIVGDLVTAGAGPAAPRAARLAWRLEGVDGALASPRSVRASTRNRRAARAACERILAWDFDRVVTGHGPLVESGGHAALARALAWL